MTKKINEIKDENTINTICKIVRNASNYDEKGLFLLSCFDFLICFKYFR